MRMSRVDVRIEGGPGGNPSGDFCFGQGTGHHLVLICRSDFGGFDPVLGAVFSAFTGGLLGTHPGIDVAVSGGAIGVDLEIVLPGLDCLRG